VLEALGVRIDLAPADVAECIDTVGFGFLFAQAHHPAMRHVGPVRQELGIRTVFNLLGPLANPAGASHQVLGVADPALLRPMAEALLRLGVEDSVVVHGRPGYDEATPAGPFLMLRTQAGTVHYLREVDPLSLGLPRASPDELAPIPREQAAEMARKILRGEPGPRSDMVALNAALGFLAAGHDPDLPNALASAQRILASGRAADLLDAYCKDSQQAEETGKRETP